jgi:hypothetical protein
MNGNSALGAAFLAGLEILRRKDAKAQNLEVDEVNPFALSKFSD